MNWFSGDWYLMINYQLSTNRKSKFSCLVNLMTVYVLCGKSHVALYRSWIEYRHCARSNLHLGEHYWVQSASLACFINLYPDPRLYLSTRGGLATTTYWLQLSVLLTFIEHICGVRDWILINHKISNYASP